jgi:hypothetical protein
MVDSSFCDKSVQKCPGDWGLIFFIINIILPGWGTIGSAFCSDKGINCEAIVVGILQFATLFLILIGWFWSIYWGYLIYQKSK